MESIDALQRSKTLIMVEHRLATIRDCDRIYEIADGVTVEREREDLDIYKSYGHNGIGRIVARCQLDICSWSSAHHSYNLSDIEKASSCILPKQKVSVNCRLKYSIALMTYCYVCIVWVFFRAESVSQVFDILKRMVSGAAGIHYIYSYAIIYGILIVICHLYGIWKNSGQGTYPILKLEKFRSKIVLCVVVGLIMVFSYQGESPFVYFQF